MATVQQDTTTESPLLETKFYAPTWRAGLVQRPRLTERLERGVQRQVTLISAPAGSGKTTLLGEWLAAVPERPVAWLSLDASDSAPGRFWEYVVEALQRAQPGLGARALAMLRTRQSPPIESILTALLNEVAIETGDIVLVLDDYHVIESAPIHDAVSFLIDHMPPQLHLVIASRADPALPLARLRARGELIELRAADLGFSTEEAAAFLNETMGLALAPEDVASLEARTEGWVAGLQLAALSMQGRDDTGAFVSAFAGDDRYVIDYLLDEVLRRQPSQVRDFLLKTSVLDRLCGSLCDALTGRTDGAATLEELDRANLFVVPLDGRRQWYRYHHLFAEVLRAHLASEAGNLVSDLHRRASEWFAETGQTPEAITHALRGGHHDLAATLIESVAREMVRAYRPLQLLEWLRQLPEEVVEGRPFLCAYYAFGLFPAGEMDAAMHWLDVASNVAGGGAGDAAGSLPGIIAVARGYHAMAIGDVAATVGHARRALEVLPADEPTWRAGAALLLSLAPWRMGDLNAAAEAHAPGIAGLERAGDTALAISALYDAGKLATWRGQLREARGHYERALQLWEAAMDPFMPGAADAHLGLGALAVEGGDVESAREHQRLAEELAEQALLPETLSRLAIGRARLLEAAGDLDAAIDELTEAEQFVVPATVPSFPVSARRARLALRAGRVAEVEAWAVEHGLASDEPMVFAREYELLTFARLLIERSREDDPSEAGAALELLERLHEGARGLRDGSVLEILILQSLAHQVLRDVDAALLPFGEALSRAEPEGYRRVFVVEGEPMRELLRSAIALGISTAYATSLLDALGESGAASPPTEDGVAALPEPLTAREVEILRLIAAGMRNQEIADHLVISVATVKRHIANTYGKLDVAHRTEAIVRANELRLI